MKFPPATRTSDPHTSHMAEAKITRSGKRELQRQEVLRLVREHPLRTSLELTQWTDLDRYQISRRLSDLETQRAVHKASARFCEVGGNRMIVWGLGPKGENEEPLNMGGRTVSQSLQERFAAKVSKGRPDDCWLWTGARTSWGYGHIWLDGRMQSAPRVAWVLANDCDIPKDMHILHICDTPACVNPRHLRLGTQKDNIHDAINKGRFSHGFQRQEYCKRGIHKLEPHNLYLNKYGKRQCLACMRRPRATPEDYRRARDGE